MSYKISDSVAMRMIQIFQEAVIFGIDGADLMRQVRLTQDPQDPESMTLDPEYAASVEKMHEKYLTEAASKQQEDKIVSVFTLGGGFN
jgi:hypothetical protein